MEQWSQNFALARLVGLKPSEDTGKWMAIGENFHGYDDEGHIVIIPDFYNSLDELRWVGESLTPEQHNESVRQLCIICDREYGNSEITPSDVLDPAEMAAMFLSCPPNFRTEAILKATKLWREA
jgi:hypothetical protein